MNKINSMQPSLIDASLLQSVSTSIELANARSPIIVELELICVKILLFIKNNIFYIAIFSAMVYYMYYCYKQHKKTKEEAPILKVKKPKIKCEKTEQQILPGDYVSYGNKTQIIQRPVVAYPKDDINAEIRKYWLDDVKPKPDRYIPRQWEVPKLCNRTPTYENIINNIYGQPIGPMIPPSQYSCNEPISGYEDTYFIKTKSRDCSEEFDDQFYDYGMY